MIYTYAFTSTLEQTGTVTRLKELDIDFICIDTPTEPCPECLPADSIIIPFFDGDVFCYTTQYTIVDVFVYNIDGTLIGTFNSWANGNLLCINTDDILVDCFYVGVSDSLGNNYCFERGYSRASDIADCGIPVIRIESFYDDTDCAGNNYQAGYSNALNFTADFDKIRVEEDATVVNNKRIRTDIYEVYQVRILQPLAPSSQTLIQLSTITLRGMNLTVTEANGTQHVFQDFTGVISREYETSHDWYPIFELRKLVCSIDELCSF